MARMRLGSKLFVRSCYVDVWPEVEKALNEGKATLILGTPGIGKSHFGFLILLLLVRRGETVVYQGREERSRILFSAPSVQVSGIQNRGFDSELDNPNVYYMVDGEAPSIVNAKTILLASPRDTTWNVVSKASKGTFFYLPPWSLGELKKCRESIFDQKVTEAQVDELFRKWGGVARFVLEYANDPTQQDQLDKAIATSKLRSIADTIDALTQAKDVSHKVVHFIPKDNFRSYTTSFASEYVADKIYAEITERNFNDVRDFLNGSMGLGDFGASRGRVFERYIHFRFERGGTFQTRNLRTGAVENLVIPASVIPKMYLNVAELQAVAPNVYARPRQSDAKSIDGVMKPNWLFQITVAEKHDCREDGLAEVLDAMGLTTDVLQDTHRVFTPPFHFKLVFVHPRPRLYFVVPKDKFPAFGQQNYSDKNDHVLHAASSMDTQHVWQLEQWVLEVSLTS